MSRPRRAFGELKGRRFDKRRRQRRRRAAAVRVRRGSGAVARRADARAGVPSPGHRDDRGERFPRTYDRTLGRRGLRTQAGAEIGTEGSAARWKIEDFQERTRSAEQPSRAAIRDVADPREGRDLMRKAGPGEARDGWRQFVAPLAGDAQWERDGALPERLAALTIAVDSWGAPPLRVWLDGVLLGRTVKPREKMRRTPAR
jgi:hypothetical protein